MKSLLKINLLILSLIILIFAHTAIANDKLIKLPYPMNEDYFVGPLEKVEVLSKPDDWQLPDNPEEMMVYKEKNGPLKGDEFEYVIDLAKKVKIKGDLKISFDEKDKEIEAMGKPGEWLSFRNNIKDFKISYEYSQFLDWDETTSKDKKIQDVLDFLKEIGLYKDNLFVNKIAPWEIIFRRKIGGYPVEMGWINIGIDRNEKKYSIESIHHTMRDWLPFQKYPIKTAEEAYQEFLNGKASFRLHPMARSPEGPSFIGTHLEKMYLAYYEYPAGDEQTYLQPVYVVALGNREKAYIPAIKAEYVENSKKKPWHERVHGGRGTP